MAYSTREGMSEFMMICDLFRIIPYKKKVKICQKTNLEKEI